MSNFTSSIKIENFKSIKSLELGDCRRINLFIGRPNVGKSNILEALSLFSLTYFEKADLKDLIRVEQPSELFFDGDMTKNVIISMNNENVVFIDPSENLIRIVIGEGAFSYFLKVDLTMERKRYTDSDYTSLPSQAYPYKSYLFPNKMKFGKSNDSYLHPIHGENIYNAIQSHPALKQEVMSLFKNYNLSLVFDKSSQELKIMKGFDQGEILLIPFSSIADSLQRLIFYKAAIKSNTDSVITFEEPEAHTYPPYIAQIAQDIIESKTNQFFITTHSPYVVNEMLENAQNELAIYLVDLKDGQTVAKRLSDSELDEIYNAGIDLFFNEEFFI
ncbi:ATP-dependent endonuclease [Dysgonomonas sp. 25]|uniref:ATP-dependent nuclease n=1 Tax=Dysgonomonas sp. 25 TaxID=2302933 RepID=UPI0013CF55E3|nr:AAA family ATPase [Dysgonomonas sp. 25]NDV67565.1 hypothetical protein [Dysgonomonas sp. 25]